MKTVDHVYRICAMTSHVHGFQYKFLSCMEMHTESLSHFSNVQYSIYGILIMPSYSGMLLYILILSHSGMLVICIVYSKLLSHSGLRTSTSCPARARAPSLGPIWPAI